MTGSIRIFEKSNFTPKLSVLVFLKVKLPNMTDWHNISEKRQKRPFWQKVEENTTTIVATTTTTRKLRIRIGEKQK